MVKKEDPSSFMALSCLRQCGKSRYQGLEYRPKPAQAGPARRGSCRASTTVHPGRSGCTETVSRWAHRSQMGHGSPGRISGIRRLTRLREAVSPGRPLRISPPARGTGPCHRLR